MVYASLIALGSIHSPPPIELKIKGKKYGYLDDSSDYSAMERQLKLIKKQGEFYAVIVSFTIKKQKEGTTPLKYALYIARRVRR